MSCRNTGTFSSTSIYSKIASTNRAERRMCTLVSLLEKNVLGVFTYLSTLLGARWPSRMCEGSKFEIHSGQGRKSGIYLCIDGPSGGTVIPSRTLETVHIQRGTTNSATYINRALKIGRGGEIWKRDVPQTRNGMYRKQKPCYFSTIWNRPTRVGGNAIRTRLVPVKQYLGGKP